MTRFFGILILLSISSLAFAEPVLVQSSASEQGNTAKLLPPGQDSNAAVPYICKLALDKANAELKKPCDYLEGKIITQTEVTNQILAPRIVIKDLGNNEGWTCNVEIQGLCEVVFPN